MSTRRQLLKSGFALVAAGGGTFPAASHAAPGTEAEAAPSPAPHYQAALDAACETTRQTGASFAYWDGAALHTAVSGVRNSVTGDPVTPDTLMHVGSITKVANAVLVMQLVDDGLIALDDPVLKHVPELRTRDMASLGAVTCAMLINHTSGIDGEWLPEFGPDQERIVDTITRCADLGQLFPPGTATSYNNVATVIAGYLVQKLRGASWYTLMKTRIYEPLGMTHALVDPLDVPRFRVSIGDLTNYETGGMMQTTRPFLAPSLAPAGTTQMTSAADLVVFARALIGRGMGANGARILSARSAAAMVSRTAEFVRIGREHEAVGLGWMLRAGGIVTHGGGGPGVSSVLVAHPASGCAAALLTNCDRGDALMAAFLDPITHSWTGLPEAPPLQRSQRPVDIQRYIGTYENNADRFVVTGDANGLSLRTEDKLSTYDNSNLERPAYLLHAMEDDVFERPARVSGAPALLMRFVETGTDGKMRFLADGGRLLARAS